MKFKKTLIWMMVCTMMVSLCYIKVAPNDTTASAATTNTTASMQYAAAMNPGWNLGNTFDATGNSGEESWGNPKVTRDLIKKVKEQGFNSIRIPLTTDGRTGNAPDYKLDPTFLARYAEVVQWALDEGLYVMINIHHDSWIWANNIGSDDGSAMNRYKAVWTQLAACFKDYSDKVCFESLNEPKFEISGEANQIKTMDQVNTEFYKIVRNSGGKNDKRMLILPTLGTSDAEKFVTPLYNTITSLNDPNIIATVHYYGYYPFSANLGTTAMTSAVVNGLNDSFDRIYNSFISKGIGVICGEYGVLAFDKNLQAIEHGEMLKYFEYINYYAKQKNITLMLWDNGQHLGRTSLTWSDPSLYNLIKTSWTTRSSSTDSDMVFITDEAKTKDVNINMTLNGNTLKDIYNGSTKLANGTDYSVSGNTLTLKAGYVKKVITGDYGINATLTMKFSAGVDWIVNLSRYKAPTMDAGSGSSNAFVIPVKFNGSRLSSMEAFDAAGKATGPNNWLSYKEYFKDFIPDYTANNITVKKNFFDSTPDGAVTLKFHFQSGEVLQCKLKKDKTSVIAYFPVPTARYTTTTLNVGGTWIFKISDMDESAKVTYSSNKKSVATVSKDGGITAKKKGTAKITAKVVQNNKTYNLTMTVTVK